MGPPRAPTALSERHKAPLPVLHGPTISQRIGTSNYSASSDCPMICRCTHVRHRSLYRTRMCLCGNDRPRVPALPLLRDISARGGGAGVKRASQGFWLTPPPPSDPYTPGRGGGVEEQGTWASRTQKHSEAGYGRPVDRGAWTAKTVKRPRQQPAHPQYANYWAPLTRRRHTTPHPAQSQHTNDGAPRTRKRHQQEHRPQRPTERSDPTQHAKGRTGDCPGPRKGATTRRNVTRGGGGCHRIWSTADVAHRHKDTSKE